MSPISASVQGSNLGLPARRLGHNAGMRWALGILASVVIGLSAPPAAAAPSEADKLYVEGVKHLAKGELEKAVERFERALALEPSAPLLFNLGQAQLKLGRLVAAKKSLVEAVALAEKKGPKSIVELATTALGELGDRVPQISIEAVRGVSGAKVTLDGAEVAADGKGIDVDPGRHEVVVTAPGYERFKVSLELAEGDRERVTPTLVSTSEKGAADPEPVVAERQRGSTPVAPLVVGGLGLVAVGAAGYFYLQVKDIEDDRKALWEESGCPGPTCPNGEPGEAESLREDAESKARLGNILLGVGATAIVAGGVWYYFASRPKKTEAAVVVSPVPGGAIVSGRF